MILPHNVVDVKELRERRYIFKDRVDAGRRLAEKVYELIEKVDLVYAIPRGGVPIGIEVAKRLNTKMDLLPCRKLVLPFNREAGFGAIDPDGEVYLNRELIDFLRLDSSVIEIAKKETLKELNYLNKVFRKGRGYNVLKDSVVIIVDDGLASGYTMTSAVEFLRRKEVEKVIVASPTASLNAVELLSTVADLLIILNIRSDLIYAVADAYINWYDLTNLDVINYLKSNKGLLSFEL